MSGERTERRSGEDRREKKDRLSLRYLLMGKRSGPRRAAEWQPNIYTEVYGPKILLASFSLVFLSMTDAMFTLYHVGRGAKEINPTMDLLLQMGETQFFYVKYALTCLGALFLCIHKNFPYVKKILIFLICVYILVISWHIYLLKMF